MNWSYCLRSLLLEPCFFFFPSSTISLKRSNFHSTAPSNVLTLPCAHSLPPEMLSSSPQHLNYPASSSSAPFIGSDFDEDISLADSQSPETFSDSSDESDHSIDHTSTPIANHSNEEIDPLLQAFYNQPAIPDDTQPLAVGSSYTSWKSAKAAVIYHCFSSNGAVPKPYHANNQSKKIWECKARWEQFCAFRVYLRVDPIANNVRVVTLNDKHTCVNHSIPARLGIRQRAYIDSEVSSFSMQTMNQADVTEVRSSNSISPAICQSHLDHPRAQCWSRRSSRRCSKSQAAGGLYQQVEA